MKVVWDGRVLSGPEVRGIGSYVVNMLAAFRSVRPSLEVEVLVEDQLPDDARAQGYPVRRVGPSRGYRWQLWERVGLPWHAARAGADLIHSPANTLPGRSRLPRVVSLHDVIPYLPDIAGQPLNDPYWTRVLPRAIRSADAILTCSEASRADIARVLGVDRTKITVVPYATSPDVAPPSDSVSLIAACGIKRRYLLALAATAPRKNTTGVLRVFARVARDVPDVQLVLTGVSGALKASIVRTLADLEIPESRVHLLEFVDMPTRNALYAGSAAFLFLSLYEGFGLPILEAMRCGTPVISSNRASCPEVAGTAAIVVDPENVTRVAAEIVNLLSRSDTERQAWIDRGRAHEATFSWTAAAEITLDAYDRVTG